MRTATRERQVGADRTTPTSARSSGSGPSREAFAALREAVESRHDRLRTRRTYSEETPDDGGVVTPARREAPVTTLEAGHFKVSRHRSQGDLAAALDVSDQAVSSRLRRGTVSPARSVLGGGDRSAVE